MFWDYRDDTDNNLLGTENPSKSSLFVDDKQNVKEIGQLVVKVPFILWGCEDVVELEIIVDCGGRDNEPRNSH